MPAVFTALLVLSIWVAAVVGWVINLVDVFQLAVADAPMTSLFIVKIVGVFLAPLGSLLGLFA